MTNIMKCHGVKKHSICCDRRLPHIAEYFERAPNGNLRKTCRDCRQKAIVENKKKVPRIKSEALRKYNRDWWVKNKYGITSEEYEEMLKRQNGVCYICEKPETATFKGEPARLSVDHCHKTGAIRKLLCRNCNTTVGRLELESPVPIEEQLKRLGEYLGISTNWRDAKAALCITTKTKIILC
jgi:hypothetical protein